MAAYGTGSRRRPHDRRKWEKLLVAAGRLAANGTLESDEVTLVDDPNAGTALLLPMMRGGRQLGAGEQFTALRARCARELAALPASLRRLTPAARPFRAGISARLHELADRLDRDSH